MDAVCTLKSLGKRRREKQESLRLRFSEVKYVKYGECVCTLRSFIQFLWPLKVILSSLRGETSER